MVWPSFPCKIRHESRLKYQQFTRWFLERDDEISLDEVERIAI